MISIAIILALSAVFIMGLVTFWRKMIEWIKKAVNKIMEVLGIAVEGTRTFIVRTREGLKNKAKYYNQNKITKEWEETVYTKNVDESEVPPEILAKVNAQDFDVDVSITKELELVISA